MQPWSKASGKYMGWFQSSPGQKAGCNAPRRRLEPQRQPGFNPHPARRPDATRRLYRRCNGRYRFQSSPGQKAGCNIPVQPAHARAYRVSILTRPEGRMQHLFLQRQVCPGSFQSSPGQKAGCNHCLPPFFYAPFTGFQSSPGQKAGCNCRTCRTSGPPPRSFNPHPARRPDATMMPRTECVSSAWRFQSSPGQKAGCNHDVSGILPGPLPVSILTRPEGRMQLAICAVSRFGCYAVSILTRPEGRMQPRPAGLR